MEYTTEIHFTKRTDGLLDGHLAGCANIYDAGMTVKCAMTDHQAFDWQAAVAAQAYRWNHARKVDAGGALSDATCTPVIIFDNRI